LRKKKIHETQYETNTISNAKPRRRAGTANSVGRCAQEGDVKLTDWIRAGTMNGGGDGGDGGTGFGGENVSNNNNNNNNTRTARCVRVRAGPSLVATRKNRLPFCTAEGWRQVKRSGRAGLVRRSLVCCGCRRGGSGDNGQCWQC